MRKITIITMLATVILGVGSLHSIWLALYEDTRYFSVQPQLRKFSSHEELKSFLDAKRDVSPYYIVQMDRSKLAVGLASVDALKASFGFSDSLPTIETVVIPPHSTTNVQVEGVDEADMVKTDGEFIYTISRNRLFILKAYPVEEAKVLAQIQMNGTVKGTFINGDRLVIIEEEDRKTFIRIFDTSDRRNPSQARTISKDGSYVSSRKIGDYIYVLTTMPANCRGGEVELPKTYFPDRVEEMPADEVFYIDAPDYSYQFTTIMAINANYDEEPTQKVILVGDTREVYASPNNIYIAFRDFERTLIHRIHVEGKEIQCAASGEVPGYVLNQFSMDEYCDYFRVATTTGNVVANSANHVYVLDMDLSVVGRLEELASGETLHSARFMGNRCYLVTFKKIDPFFVIDLEDPSRPRVLGELKISGYSDYLHPCDEDHILGIGKETVEEVGGNFAWYQGVKISLFDVSDIGNPREVAKYEIGDRGTDSPVLSDHKALLFDRSRNLLVVPALVSDIDPADYPQGVPPHVSGVHICQGAYVFSISQSYELVFRGRITHINETSTNVDSYTAFYVKRTLYLGDVLYTLSDIKVKMNDFETLSEINEIQLSP
jgi:inhibitor of cysteine peptidase